MIKKVIRLFVVIISSFVFICFSTDVLAATLSVDPSSGTFNKGCPASIKVNLDTNGAQVDGVDVVLKYTQAQLSVTPGQISTNAAMFPDFPGTSVNTSAGEINISGEASATAPFSGKGTMATINFTVPQDAPAGSTSLNFSFDPTKTTESNVIEHTTLAQLLTSVTNGSYTIGSGACGSTSTSTTSTSTTPSTIVYQLPQGGLGTPSAQLGQKTPVGGQKTTLVNTALTTPTTVFATLGTLLVIAGILGVIIL